MVQHRSSSPVLHATAAPAVAGDRRAERRPRDLPPLVRPLARIDPGDVGFAGRHAVDLVERARRAGLEPPPGFVVGTPAYAALRDGGDLRQRLEERLAGLGCSDLGPLMGRAADAGGLVLHEPMPEWMREELAAAWHDLAGADPGRRMSVVASAPRAALDWRAEPVRGLADFLAALRRCWASLYAAPQVFARARRGRSQLDAEIAAVVQPFVAPLAGG